MDYKWYYHYVPEGQIESDKHNRWAIKCYIKKGKNFPICIATITKKGTENAYVPSLSHEYCACIPVIENGVLHNNYNLFSNDIEELKKMVETEFEKIRLLFNI